MSQYVGHRLCYETLDAMLRAYEAGGYTRLVQMRPGEMVMMDSNPAPGYVPGVRGKAETGVEYVPNADGTRIHIYYLTGHKASERQKQEAERAKRSGFDSHEIMGTLISIRRVGDGSIQLQFVAGNRDVIENGVLTNKVALRSVSVTREPAQKGGLIVAMSFDQMLGIPYHMLQSMLQTEQGQSANTISEGLRTLRAGVQANSARVVSDPNPVPRNRPRTSDLPVEGE